MVDANNAVRPEPALLQALGAMTSLQALVALALPAISIPCGTDRSGLPFGLQIIAARGQDRTLLGAAQEIEDMLRT
jgi:Asp-tRNA(Asn)/Glu-tRNA(Gln) amidotransferase A subunit family amidase